VTPARRDVVTGHDSTMRVAHLTTVDLSLRFLLWPQLLSIEDAGGEAIGISSPGPWVAELEEAGITHIPLQSSTRGMNVVSDFKAAAQLWREVRKASLTVLHTHNPKPGIYGRILGRLAGVPVVINTMHGFYATETDPVLKRLLIYGLEAVASRFSDAELHQNPEDLQLAKRLRIVPRRRARLLGNGIDLERFDPSATPSGVRDRIRGELGVSPEDLVVGSVGRLVAEKGYLELLEAAERLGDGFVFVIVGPKDSDKADAIPAAVVEDAEAHGVRVLGMRTDVEDLYPAMDMFVLPSHREGFPRAAMEAAAMGLPIVATDIRGCRQVVEDGVNGLLVPVRDADSLVRAIRSLAEDPVLRTTMSEASRRIAVERFDETDVVRLVLETYRDVLEAKGMSHMMPAGMLAERVVSAPREAGPADSRALANLHFDLIGGGFLPRLGRSFMRVLYRGLLDWPGTKTMVAEDGGGITGFVVAVDDIGAFYRFFIRKRWLSATLAAFPALLDPRVVRRAWESMRYGSEGDAASIPAEILSLGVAARARGQGLSGTLLKSVLEELESAGSTDVKVVVGSSNSVAIAAYERAGFTRHDTIEVHRGESSEVLIWRPT